MAQDMHSISNMTAIESIVAAEMMIAEAGNRASYTAIMCLAREIFRNSNASVNVVKSIAA